MIKTFALSLALTIAPFLNAEATDAASNTPSVHVASHVQSIFIVSDNKGAIYMGGDRIGKIRGKSETFFEISGLVPATYHLVFNRVSIEQEFDIPVAAGHDTYVHFTDNQPEIGWSESQLHYTPRQHKNMSWIAKAGIVVGGLVVIVAAVYAAGFIKSGQMSL